MRRAVWARCAARFAPGSRVLEMNCGTGEDALWLAQPRGASARDGCVSRHAASGREQTGRLAEQRVRAGSIDSPGRSSIHSLKDRSTACCPISEDSTACATCAACARSLAAKLRPGAAAVLCIMGPAVPWEWVWFLARGKPAAAFRRLRREGAQWSGVYNPLSLRRRDLPRFRARVSTVAPVRHRRSVAAALYGEMDRPLSALDRRARSHGTPYRNLVAFATCSPITTCWSSSASDSSNANCVDSAGRRRPDRGNIV